MLNRILTVALLFGAALGGGPQSPQAEPYRHDRFNTQPVDVARKFLAFSVSFDGSDDGIAMGLPEWVAYELRATPPNLTTAPDRPSTWVTDNDLFVKKIAPADASYAGSGYSRGHMCMKSHANRMSALADKETHTVLNACPQAQSMNAGSWLAIENLCGNWADTYGRVWIITGPVILANNPAKWIGDPGEVPVRVPDAFFKIVVRDSSETPEVLAFLVPMEGDESHSRQSADVRPYLTSVDIVEALTGLDFLTDIPDPLETHLEQRIYTTLWGTPVPVIADRQLPTPPAKTTARQAERTTDGGELRGGSSPTATEEALAKKLQSEGWVYIMPQPKSAQAAWGNKDGRTTWFNGSWKNSKTGRSSTEQPSESDGYQGDGIGASGYRRGGSPSAPSQVEWLCSKSGGIAPR